MQVLGLKLDQLCLVIGERRLAIDIAAELCRQSGVMAGAVQGRGHGHRVGGHARKGLPLDLLDALSAQDVFQSPLGHVASRVTVRS